MTTKELLLKNEREEFDERTATIHAALRRLGFAGYYEDRIVPYDEAAWFVRRVGYLRVVFQRHDRWLLGEPVGADNYVSVNWYGYTDIRNALRQVSDDEVPQALQTAVQAAESVPIPQAFRDRPDDRSLDTHALLAAVDARWTELFR